MTGNRVFLASILVVCLAAATGRAWAQGAEIEFEVEEQEIEFEANEGGDVGDGAVDGVAGVESFLGTFRFGMTQKELFAHLEKEVKQRYAEQIKAALDLYAQDKLRKKEKEEIERLRKNVIEFAGKRTGWDASVIDDQFAHNNHESMVVSWEGAEGLSQRRFFFFFKGRLYKVVFTLDVSDMSAEQRDFNNYKALLTQRFGRGQDDYGDLLWNIGRYRVAALNKLTFYSSFCLIIADRGMFIELLKARKKNATEPKQKKKSSIVNSLVTDDPNDSPSLDQKSDVIDRILGK